MGLTEPRQGRHRTTKDLALAAYVHMLGLKIVKAEECRRGSTNEYMFTFEDPDGEWEGYHISYANSEASRFDNSVRNLKKLCKRNTAR